MGKIYNDVEKQTNDDVVKDMMTKLLNVGYVIEGRSNVKFRENEINRVYNIMDKSNFKSVLLVGDYGSGKRTIIEGYVNKLQKNVRGDMVIGVDFNDVIHQATSTNFTQTVNDIFSAATLDELNVTLVVNNIGHLLNINCYGNAGFSFVNTLISAIEDKNMRIIATVTNDEYKTIEDAFKRVLDFFTIIRPLELTKDQTAEILEGERFYFESEYQMTLPKNFSDLICTNADKYIKDRVFPGKAEQLVDEVCASIANKKRIVNDKAKAIGENIQSLKLELQDAVDNNDYMRAEDVNKKIERNLKKLEKLGGDEDETPVIEIDESDVLEAIGEIVGVQMSRLSKDQTAFLREMPVELKKTVIGQDEAVDVIVKNIRRNQLGLRKTSHSMGNFMFIGSTGVGKTFLAKQLAKYLYGSEDSFLRLDMSEFQSEIDVSKLLGSAPGYVGYKESGLLVKGLAKKPETVVLFDEIEKAHPKIYDVLLQLLDEGFITGSDGKKVDATKALIIFTSNIGVKEAREMSSPMGFAKDMKDLTDRMNEKKESIIRKALKNRFSPEFLNRLDNICYFNPLNRDTLKSILLNELAEANTGIKGVTGKTVELSHEVEDWILDKVEKEDNGARPIIRILQQNIEEPISDMIINEDKVLNTRKKTLTASLADNSIVLK